MSIILRDGVIVKIYGRELLRESNPRKGLVFL
jgi:hypothetical protein